MGLHLNCFTYPVLAVLLVRVVAENLNRAWPISFRNTSDEKSTLITTDNLRVSHVLSVTCLFFANALFTLNFTDTFVTASCVDERMRRRLRILILRLALLNYRPIDSN